MIRSKRTRRGAWGEWSETTCLTDLQMYAYTHTRVRACVHFHRARRNCKVAYMQGVKLRGQSFDPRAVHERGSRYRSVATANSLARLALPSRWVSSESDCATELLVSGRERPGRVSRSMKFDERTLLPPLISNLFWSPSLAIYAMKLRNFTSITLPATRSLLRRFLESNVLNWKINFSGLKDISKLDELLYLFQLTSFC